MTSPTSPPDVEARLRDALAPFRSVTLAPDAARTAAVRGRRMRRVRRSAATLAPVVAAALVVGAVVLVGSLRPDATRGGPSSGPAPTAEGWARAAASPLSPRMFAQVVPFGDEVLVLGGTSGSPCPPNASCVASPDADEPHRDGAAYDVAHDRWRRIADAPVPLDVPVVAVGADRVYVLTHPASYGPDAGEPPTERAFLVYSPADDRWSTLPAPPAPVAGIVPVGGGRVLAYGYAHVAGGTPDLLFDPQSRRWSTVPEDPLPGTEGRTVLPLDDGDAVLVAVPQDGTSPFRPWRLARWSATTGTWSRVPASGTVASSPSWFVSAGLVVNPSSEVVEVDGARRETGGILDPATRTWSDVPPFAPRPGQQPSASGAGRIVVQGGVLDVPARRWTPLPDRPGALVAQSGEAVTPGGVLALFGGVRSEGDGAWTKDAMTADLWLLRLP